MAETDATAARRRRLEQLSQRNSDLALRLAASTIPPPPPPQSASAAAATRSTTQAPARSPYPVTLKRTDAVSAVSAAATVPNTPEWINLKLRPVPHEKLVAKKSSVTHWPKVSELIKRHDSASSPPPSQLATTPLSQTTPSNAADTYTLGTAEGVDADQDTLPANTVLTAAQKRAASPTLLQRGRSTTEARKVFNKPDQQPPTPLATPPAFAASKSFIAGTPPSRSRSTTKPNFTNSTSGITSPTLSARTSPRTRSPSHAPTTDRSKSTPASSNSRPTSPHDDDKMDAIMATRVTPSLPRPFQETEERNAATGGTIDSDSDDASDCSAASTTVSRVSSRRSSVVAAALLEQRREDKVRGLKEFFDKGAVGAAPLVPIPPGMAGRSKTMTTTGMLTQGSLRLYQDPGTTMATPSAFFAGRSASVSSSGAISASPPSRARSKSRAPSARIPLPTDADDERTRKKEFRGVVGELGARLEASREVAPLTSNYRPYADTNDRVVNVRELLGVAAVTNALVAEPEEMAESSAVVSSITSRTAIRYINGVAVEVEEENAQAPTEHASKDVAVVSPDETTRTFVTTTSRKVIRDFDGARSRAKQGRCAHCHRFGDC
ncbi:hypothetical protein BC830DRAFT_786036 [Chytriomyces sp. MP71]|nr:hypothetical protein BC830DRAFT_786036 [Chytriomyces sp. MP71]